MSRKATANPYHPLLVWLALLLILLLASWLRLANLRDNPGWYSDEGTHLAIAGELAQGQSRYLAVSGPTLLFAKLPLFEGALALLLRWGGGGMATLRAFTAGLGVLSVLLLYLAVFRVSGRQGLALLAASALAIYPQAVLYSRFGFSYNMLVPLVLLAFQGLYEFGERGEQWGLLLAAGAMGLGLISDLLIGAFVPVLLVVAAAHRHHLSRRLALTACVLLALPFAVYAVVLLLAAPDALWFDLTYTLNRLGGVSISRQLWTLAENYALLLLQDSWWVAGLAGLFWLPGRQRSLALLFLLLPIAIVGRTEALHGLSFYYVIPLFPFVALGVGALLHNGVPLVTDRMTEQMPRPAAVLLGLVLVGTPLLISTLATGQRVQGTMSTAIDPFLVAGQDARTAAAYTNVHLSPGELVLASPTVAWLLEGDAADFQMAVAAAGRATPHLPPDIPADRWSFDPRFARARFVIVDDLWRNWAAVHVSGVREMLAAVEEWPVRLEAGRVRVYERP